jgi:hypothetical protein
MSNAFLAFLVALSGGTWTYYKMAKRTGSGNLKPALIGGAVVGVVLFILTVFK